MDKLLVAAGIAIIILIMWKDRTKINTLQKEKEDGRLLLRELADARREVQILLEQLETASEKIVDEITYGLEEIKLQVSAAVENTDDGKDKGTGNDVNTPVARVVKRMPSGNPSKPKGSSQSVISRSTLTPEKTAASKAQKATAVKRERAVSSVKETRENEVPPKHQMVYAMADLGHTEEEIAKQMKIGKGEVSLLLQLRRKGEEGSVRNF